MDPGSHGGSRLTSMKRQWTSAAGLRDTVRFAKPSARTDQPAEKPAQAFRGCDDADAISAAYNELRENRENSLETTVGGAESILIPNRQLPLGVTLRRTRYVAGCLWLLLRSARLNGVAFDGR